MAGALPHRPRAVGRPRPTRNLLEIILFEAARQTTTEFWWIAKLAGLINESGSRLTIQDAVQLPHIFHVFCALRHEQWALLGLIFLFQIAFRHILYALRNYLHAREAQTIHRDADGVEVLRLVVRSSRLLQNRKPLLQQTLLRGPILPSQLHDHSKLVLRRTVRFRHVTVAVAARGPLHAFRLHY